MRNFLIRVALMLRLEKVANYLRKRKSEVDNYVMYQRITEEKRVVAFLEKNRKVNKG